MKAVPKQLQRNLVAILKERGLSQMALSKLTQGAVSQGTISYICRGRGASNDVLEAIAAALELPVWRLMVARDSDVALLVDAHEREDEQLRRLKRAFMLLKPGDRDFVEQLVTRMAAAGDQNR